MVYIIRSSSRGYIKIGVAIDPKRRLRDLQTGSWDTLVLVETFNTRGRDYECEAEIHRVLEKNNIKNEWFLVGWKEIIELERIIRKYNPQISEKKLDNIRSKAKTKFFYRLIW